MRRFLIGALAALAVPTAVLAQSTAQDVTVSPGEAAATALYDFCVPLFGPGAVHADRLSATAAMAGLETAPRGAQPMGLPRAQGAFTAPYVTNGQVAVFWVSEPTICQIIIAGPIGAGADLLASLTPTGWTPAETDVPTGPDTVADLWVVRPRGYGQDLLLVANRWVAGAEPRGGVRLVINLMRAEP